MATIKKPKTDDAVTARTEGGDHPRGAQAKNYERDRRSPPAAGEPGPGGAPGGQHGAGKHVRGNEAGPDDLARDPGIDTSGQSDRDDVGIGDRDDPFGVDRRRAATRRGEGS